MENSEIQWCDHTFDPWTDGEPRKLTSAANWRKPLAWDKAAAASGTRPRVCCASLADWLDPEVPIGWLASILALTRATPNLDWLLVTKRPELWRERLESVRDFGGVSGMAVAWLGGAPPANVWLGTSVEDQRRADERIPALLSIPARVRFLSVEPLLGSVDLMRLECLGEPYMERCSGCVRVSEDDVDCPGHEMGGIDWIIGGGESGPGARPCRVEWIRDIVRQCREAQVPVFVKQLGSKPIVSGEACDVWPDYDGDSIDVSRWETEAEVTPEEW